MEISKYYKKTLLSDGNYAIYNTLLMNVLFVNSDELVQIENMKLENRDTIHQLLHAGIYVTDLSVDKRALAERQDNVEREFGLIKVVYLILTDACNLRCTYCAVKNIADRNSIIHTDSLQKSTAHKFIIEYLRYAKDHGITDAEFIFYGGEPTINWETLTYFVETFQSLNMNSLNAKFSLVTNGTLLTAEKILFCKMNKISIGLSVDGPEWITDKGRRSPSGVGVYSKIIQTLELMSSYKYVPSLSITISQEVLEQQTEMLDWLKKITSKYGIKDVAYNLLHFQGADLDRIQYCQQATKFIIQSYIECGDFISENRINRKIKSLLSDSFFYGDCAAITGNQIVLKANGDISLCQAFCQSSESTVDNINTSELSDIIANSAVPALMEYKPFLPIYRNRCQECEALFSCGGGCYWDIDDEEKYCDTGFCHHSKIIHEWLLNYLYNFAD